jgi:RsmE family RNA methyltransferase
MQSRRVWLPRVVGPETFASIALRSGAVLAEPSGEPFSTLTSVPTTVVIGPEGGFSEDELAVGVPRVCLGTTVLRVETAALVAAVTLAL